jgi:hypothetical protein
VEPIIANEEEGWKIRRDKLAVMALKRKRVWEGRRGGGRRRGILGKCGKGGMRGLGGGGVNVRWLMLIGKRGREKGRWNEHGADYRK